MIILIEIDFGKNSVIGDLTKRQLESALKQIESTGLAKTKLTVKE